MEQIEQVDYDRVWEEDWKDITSYGVSYRTRYRLILGMMKKYSPKRGKLLDVGCGDGRLLSLIGIEFPKLHLSGFDVSAAAVRKGRLKLKVGDITKKETLPNDKFDVIICSEVLEHIKDHVEAIKNLSSLLKEEGCIIITSPYGMKNWTPHDDFAHHIRRWEDGELEGALKQAGISPFDCRVWGAGVYSAYYSLFLAKHDPSKVNSKSFLKEKIIAPTLYQLFRIDDILPRKTKGRILVVIGMKMKEGWMVQNE